MMTKATTKSFGCDAYPKLCEAPFNCQDLIPARAATSFALFGVGNGVAAPGHGNNPKVWCMSPQYANYAHACMSEKDLVKAAHIQYNETKSNKFGPTTLDADGSYCFLDGHCTNSEVTTDTTLAEAEQMCDARFGHEAWTRVAKMPIIKKALKVCHLSCRDVSTSLDEPVSGGTCSCVGSG